MKQETGKCLPGVSSVEIAAATISAITVAISIKYAYEWPTTFNYLVLCCALSLTASLTVCAIGCSIGSVDMFHVAGGVNYLISVLYECLVLYRFAVFSDLIWYPKWFMQANMAVVIIMGIAGFTIHLLTVGDQSNISIFIIMATMSIHGGSLEFITGSISLRILYKLRRDMVYKADLYNRALFQKEGGGDYVFNEIRKKVALAMLCLAGVIVCLLAIAGCSFAFMHSLQLSVAAATLGIAVASVFSAVYFRLIANIAQEGLMEHIKMTSDIISSVKSSDSSYSTKE